VSTVATGSVCGFNNLDLNNLTGGFSMTAGTGPTSTTTAGPAMIGDGDEASLLSRRKVFAVGSAGALAACLAACGGSSSGDGVDGTAAPDNTASAGSEGATATATAGSGAGAQAVALAKLSAVPVGGAIKVTFEGKPVIVSQPTKGTAAAFSAVCPHQGGIVAPNGKVLLCPLHGSTFADATGKNLSGPAAGVPLTPISVKVDSGNIVPA
jgi:nitrite reductase/ring-hydroxylating ferredoxin subunit